MARVGAYPSRLHWAAGLVLLLTPLASSFAPSMLRVPGAAPPSRQQCAAGVGTSFALGGRRDGAAVTGMLRWAPVRGVRPLTMVLAAEDGIEYDEMDLKKLKVAELKELCRSAGVSVTGKKAELIQRLLDAQPSVSNVGDEARGEEAGEGAAMAVEGEWMDAEDSLTAAQGKSLPVVEDLRFTDAPPDMPEKATMGGLGRMVTKARTGNCWHGLFFDIENVGNKAVSVKAIKTGSSPEPPAPVREDRMTCMVFECDGSAAGKELDISHWRQIGVGRQLQFPIVAYGEPDAFYGAVPLHSPIRIEAGATKGICLFTDSWRGVVLRAKLGSRFEAGETTDEDDHIRLGAGLLPVNDGGFEDGMFKEVYSDQCGDAFVGAIEYELE